MDVEEQHNNPVNSGESSVKRGRPKKDAAPKLAMSVEMWAIGRVKPYANNARIWKDGSVERLAKSIKTFGWRQPIVVEQDGTIIVGTRRRAAAGLLGEKFVPVHVVKDMTPDQIKAYRLQDNKSHDDATFDPDKLAREILQMKVVDFDIDLTGFSEMEIMEGIFGGKKRGPKKKLPGESAAEGGLVFRVVVDANSETHQKELLERFRSLGLKAKPLIS